MKKKIVKICVLLLSVVMCFSAFGCKKDNDDKGGSDIKPIDNAFSLTEDYKGGTHVFKAEDTDSYLVSDGETEYKLVYPSDFTANEQKAVDEFVYFFAEATGITLAVIKDDGLTHSASGKYISVGNTSLLASSGIDTDETDLGRDGCRIVTKDDTVYIFGGSDGVIYGVYDFMQITFNYEIYYVDCFEIDKNVNDLKLKNYDVTDMPDIPDRYKCASRLSGDDGTRFRVMHERINEVLPIHREMGNRNSPGADGSSRTHNSTSYFLPPAQYQSIHPKWYSDVNSEQLCWTAHGDAEELESMARTIAEKITWSLRFYTPVQYPDYNNVLLSIEDGDYNLCKCQSCQDGIDKYGSDAGAAVILMNRVAEIVDEWMEKEENAEYKRNLTYMFLAYLRFEKAPVKYDEALDKYVPIDEKVTPRHNVKPFLAMMKTFDYQLGLHNELNRTGYSVIDQWTDICGKIDYWLYDINYRNTFQFYDSFNFFNDAIKYLATEGVKGLYIQGAGLGGQINPPGWGALKLYLNTKLMWNVNLSAEELTDKWFEAMYKEGAEEMRKLFDEERAWNTHLMEKYDLYMIRSN